MGIVDIEIKTNVIISIKTGRDRRTSINLIRHTNCRTTRELKLRCKEVK